MECLCSVIDLTDFWSDGSSAFTSANEWDFISASGFSISPLELFISGNGSDFSVWSDGGFTSVSECLEAVSAGGASAGGDGSEGGGSASGAGGGVLGSEAWGGVAASDAETSSSGADAALSSTGALPSSTRILFLNKLTI